MATVRISGNWQNVNRMDWAGAPVIDEKGRIARTIDIPEAAYQAIEKDIAKGGIEGTSYLEDGTKFSWLIDR